MKFVNKKKLLRSGWPKSPAPLTKHSLDAKLWCVRQSSNGRFYQHYNSAYWFFEHSEDALLFRLRWSNLLK